MPATNRGAVPGSCRLTFGVPVRVPCGPVAGAAGARPDQQEGDGCCRRQERARERDHEVAAAPPGRPGRVAVRAGPGLTLPRGRASWSAVRKPPRPRPDEPGPRGVPPLGGRAAGRTETRRRATRYGGPVRGQPSAWRSASVNSRTTGTAPPAPWPAPWPAPTRRGGQVRPPFDQPRRGLVQVRQQHGQSLVPRERHLPGQQLPGHARQRVLVGPPVNGWPWTCSGEV